MRVFHTSNKDTHTSTKPHEPNEAGVGERHKRGREKKGNAFARANNPCAECTEYDPRELTSSQDTHHTHTHNHEHVKRRRVEIEARPERHGHTSCSKTSRTRLKSCQHEHVVHTGVIVVCGKVARECGEEETLQVTM